MAALTTIPFYLILTFTDTGAQQAYLFDSLANCKAAIPAMTQLYTALKQPVSIECIKSDKPKHEIKEVTTKVSYKVKTRYKF